MTVEPRSGKRHVLAAGRGERRSSGCPQTAGGRASASPWVGLRFAIGMQHPAASARGSSPGMSTTATLRFWLGRTTARGIFRAAAGRQVFIPCSGAGMISGALSVSTLLVCCVCRVSASAVSGGAMDSTWACVISAITRAFGAASRGAAGSACIGEGGRAIHLGWAARFSDTLSAKGGI